jgi:hypothetical protein
LATPLDEPSICSSEVLTKVSRLLKWPLSLNYTPMWRDITSTSWRREVMSMLQSYALQVVVLGGHQSVIRQRLNCP